jgi:hypothetical protein
MGGLIKGAWLLPAGRNHATDDPLASGGDHNPKVGEAKQVSRLNMS